MKPSLTDFLQGELSRPSRILLLLVALALIPGLFLPVWQITLHAPQYPGGLTVDIYANTVGGDLQEVNGLNHYIGMAEIHPDEFPEFKFIPFFILRFLAFAGLAFLVARIPIAAIGYIDFALFGVVMLADFQGWLTRYGQNLDPAAAIEIEPFTPKFLGTTEVGQFAVTSFPTIATGLMALAGLAGPAILLYEWRRRRAGASGDA
ncbi:MAG: hypothetical protein R3266_01950 [Gemmatimonadota bacterium]|nr:hypothetical protein [Gemmatimonadota bacterium]